MRIVMAGGGTGGHVFMGVAIAQEIKRQHPDAGFLFVGSQSGLEVHAVPKAGFALRCLRVSGFKGKPWWQKCTALFQAFCSISAAYRVLRAARPQAVLGLGGYASVPTMLAAKLLRIPTALCEPNTVPGCANALLGPFVHRIYGGFSATRHAFLFSKRRFLHTGIPIRKHVASAHPPVPISGKNLRVVVLGGSQGAHALNCLVPKALDALQRQGVCVQVLHQTGQNDCHAVQKVYTNSCVSQATVVPFVEDMAAAYATCDVLIARSGAATCAEIAQVGLASVLIPLPTSTEDHQLHNARALSQGGAAVVLQQKTLTPERLAQQLATLAHHEAQRCHMQALVRKHARPDAAKQIAEDLHRLVVQNGVDTP